MAGKIAFVIDSTNDPKHILDERDDLFIVDAHINIEGKSFPDSDVNNAEIGGIEGLLAKMDYALKNEKTLPTSSQPSPGDFQNIYEQIASKGFTHLVGVHLSPKKSGTWGNAVSASATTSGLVYFIPQLRTANLATSIVLSEGINCYDQGGSFEDIQRAILAANNAVDTFFTVGDLIYMYKSGRIGRVQYMIGDALQLKPIIRLGFEGEQYGDFIQAGRERTWSRTIAHIASDLVKSVGDGRKYIIYGGEIMKGHAEELQGKIKEMTQQTIPVFSTKSGSFILNGGPFLVSVGLPSDYMERYNQK